jgi:hypothetical protein
MAGLLSICGRNGQSRLIANGPNCYPRSDHCAEYEADHLIFARTRLFQIDQIPLSEIPIGPFELLRLQCADLYMVEGRHKVCGDFCHFLFRYRVGRILFASLKNVLQRAAVLGRLLFVDTPTVDVVTLVIRI